MSEQPLHPMLSLEDDDKFNRDAKGRQRTAYWGSRVFLLSLVIALLTLLALLYNIVNQAFGLVAVSYENDPATLADRPLPELSDAELIALIETHTSRGVLRRLESEQPLAERSHSGLLELVRERVIEEHIEGTWPLMTSLFNRAVIVQEVEEKYPDARVLRWRSWVRPDFITSSMSSDPAIAGIRTALLGSMFMILITMLFAFPIGVGAAIYLEEYAQDTRLNRLIQTNINNLAGVPSIIYGMLGLAIFVRALESITSGAVFGVTDTNGRTILSAGLTLSLLILPVIIISSQEAIRAVPRSLRLASYGLGGTKWQTVWDHVLPSAMPGILTGTILAMSRAIGETAPLIVVGASTYNTTDPTGIFSKFTALPIQIYQWTSRPQDEFRNIAAAAIIVLLALLLTLNATAILLRNRLSERNG